MAHRDDPWADGTLAARLEKLWGETDQNGGTLYSTAAIARQLGLSKNAIVGKAHRLDLPSRPSPIIRGGVRSSKPRPPVRPGKITLPPLSSTAFPQPVPAPTVHVPTRSRAMTVVTRAKPIAESTPRPDPAPKPYGRVIECCWPIGTPGSKTFRYCGDPSEPGKVYCPDHCKLGFRQLRDLREEDAA